MNREKKWTPGPWVRPDDGRENIIIMPEPANIGYGHKYAVCGGGNHHANAALISAAPELVEALEHQCLKCDFDRNLSNVMNGADIEKKCGDCVIGRALAKAYGEVTP